MASRYTASDSENDDQAWPRDLTRGLGSFPGGSGRGVPPPALAGGGCCCLFFICLLWSCFKGLHATLFALTRNKYTGVVHYDSLYYGGRNFIGFWNDYLIFPATIQSIEWIQGRPTSSGTRDLSPLQARTADGLMVRLGVVAKYRIVKDKIPDIYRVHKSDVEGFFVSNLRSHFQETVSQFRATELYEKRIAVSKALQETCKKVCQENLHGFLKCWRIELLDVELDKKIEDQNIREQVEKQKQRTEMMKQNASLIRTGAAVMASDFDRQIRVVEAEAKAAAFNITAEAQANAKYLKHASRATALGVIQETLKVGFTPMSNSELLQYLEKLAIMENPRGPMMYGDFQSATIFMPTGGKGKTEL